MTRLLAEAFARASKLSAKDQEALAALILDELDSAAKWDATFGSTQGSLHRLADEALSEHKAGRSKPLR